MLTMSGTIPSLSGSWWRDGSSHLVWLLYNCPSTHKIPCKYLHVDERYDGMHLLPQWTTLYMWCMKDMQGFRVFSGGHFENSLNGGYHKNQSSHFVICPHILYDLLHVNQSYSNFEYDLLHVNQSHPPHKYFFIEKSKYTFAVSIGVILSTFIN